MIPRKLLHPSKMRIKLVLNGGESTRDDTANGQVEWSKKVLAFNDNVFEPGSYLLRKTAVSKNWNK